MPASLIPFQRYFPPDQVELAERIKQNLVLLEQADQNQEKQLALLNKIGASYTMLAREDLAVPLLKQALELAKQLGNQVQEVASLLNLATAQQYVGERDLAQVLFREALQKADDYKQSYYKDFLLHHLGRCLVEQGQLEEAITCFEQALLLRQEKGDQRFIESTQRALDAVRAMQSEL